MMRLTDIRVLATLLILSLALAFGLGSQVAAALPDTFAGLHDIAGVHDASSPHQPCMQASGGDRIADCCSEIAHCSGAGCNAFVAPVGAPGFAYFPPREWTIAEARCLKGLDPPVNRHPPRDLD